MQDDKIVINDVSNEYIKTFYCLRLSRDFPLHLQ
jgi:hypothetical protein